MDQFFGNISNGAGFGLSWPTWIAAGGFVLFCLLGFYATVLLIAGRHLPVRYHFLQRPTLRGRMLVAFVLAATLPAISLALVLTERTAKERLDNTATILQSEANWSAGLARLYLSRLVSQLEDAAHTVRQTTGQSQLETERQLVQAHRMMAGVRVVVAVDATGHVFAMTRRADDAILTSDAHDETALNDDVFRRPLETGQAYVSNGIRDPHGRHPLAAAIGVPIVARDGTITGTLIGYYDVNGFSHAQSPLAEKNDVAVVILDRRNTIMYASSNARLETGVRLGDEEGVTAGLLPGQVFQFENVSGATPGRYIATSYPMWNGWRLLLFRPLGQIQAALLDEYAVALAWLVGALLISVCLALALAKGLSGPLETLDRSLRNFSLQVDQRLPRPPADAPREVATVFEHLRSLDKRLRATYRKLHQSLRQGEKLRGELMYVIANREKEIEQRTADLEAANQTLQRLSREDSLTGLANRRWFAEFLARAWQGALRDKTPLSILIIDIDCFKAYNDTYGHQAGDDCLKRVARTIRETVGRASDLVSRYGGEEFVVVLGDTPLEGGLKIAESIRAAVENLGIAHAGACGLSCVSVSIGVTSTLPTRETQPETVLVAADRAMYNAKKEGRNRVAYSTTARTGTYQALCLPANTGAMPS